MAAEHKQRLEKRRISDKSMEARMLKPSISGEHLDFEDRTLHSNLNLNMNGAYSNPVSRTHLSSNAKQLDLNAPLMSVRGIRDREEENSQSTLSRRRSSRPFFAWEKQSGNPRKSSGNLALPLLQPPPGWRASPGSPAKVRDFAPRSTQSQSQLGDEAKSEATFSVAATCFVSVVSDDGSRSCSSGKDDSVEDNCRQLQCAIAATTDDAAATRDMILMRRFLPAAKAMASESSVPMFVGGNFWRSSDHQKQLVKLDSPETRPRSKFQDLIQQQRNEVVIHEVEKDFETDEGMGGHCGPSGIGVCGLLPDLLGTFFRSAKGQSQGRITSLKRFQPRQVSNIKHQLLDYVRAELPEDTSEDDVDVLRWQRRGLKYTPSRGNHVSSPMPENIGFLGMPREGNPKAMKPLAPDRSTTRLDVFSSDDIESVSSVSLASLKLDNNNWQQSRRGQSSSSNNGSAATSVAEKVFCLDTLNQTREKATTMAHYLSMKESMELVEPPKARRQLGDLMELKAQSFGKSCRVVDLPNEASEKVKDVVL